MAVLAVGGGTVVIVVVVIAVVVIGLKALGRARQEDVPAVTEQIMRVLRDSQRAAHRQTQRDAGQPLDADGHEGGA